MHTTASLRQGGSSWVCAHTAPTAFYSHRRKNQPRCRTPGQQPLEQQRLGQQQPLEHKPINWGDTGPTRGPTALDKAAQVGECKRSTGAGEQHLQRVGWRAASPHSAREAPPPSHSSHAALQLVNASGLGNGTALAPHAVRRSAEAARKNNLAPPCHHTPLGGGEGLGCRVQPRALAASQRQPAGL